MTLAFKTPTEEYRHILDKGQDMKMDELKLLFEKEVPFNTIKEALGMGHKTLVDLTDFYGIDRFIKPRGAKQ